MKIFIVHGFNSRKHAVWMSELARLIEAGGYEIVIANYGNTGLFSVALETERVAREIASVATDGDVAIGHSNGCTAIHRSMQKYGANIERTFYLNASIDTRVELPPWMESMDVFYAPNEIATIAGAVWGTIWPPAREWGAMGRYGYKGDDERVSNHNLGDVGHSGALEFSRRERTAEAICRLLRGLPVTHDPLFRS